MAKKRSQAKSEIGLGLAREGEGGLSTGQDICGANLADCRRLTPKKRQPLKISGRKILTRSAFLSSFPHVVHGLRFRSVARHVEGGPSACCLAFATPAPATNSGSELGKKTPRAPS